MFIGSENGRAEISGARLKIHHAFVEGFIREIFDGTLSNFIYIPGLVPYHIPTSVILIHISVFGIQSLADDRYVFRPDNFSSNRELLPSLSLSLLCLNMLEIRSVRVIRVFLLPKNDSNRETFRRWRRTYFCRRS